MKTLINIIIFLITMLSVNLYANNMIDKARPYLPTLKDVIQEHWKDVAMKQIIPAQVEQESGWDKYAELHTSREWGVGFSQVSIAYDKLGKERFNNFLEAKRKIKELAMWDWDNRFDVRYQFIYLCLTDKSNFNSMIKLFTKNIDRWAGTLVSYNAGRGTVLNRRALCKVTEGCNFNLWFGGLDSVKMKGEDKLLYGQKLYEMRNRYPKNIIFKKSEKYKCMIY